MSSAIGQTKKMDSAMSGLSSRLGGLLAGVSIVGFGNAVIESLKNYEYFSASLRVLMHGDKDAAGALQSQLVQLAKTTPFSLVDVQDSSKKLLAYGFAAGDVIHQMKMLGDVSAATGNQIGDVAYLYGTLRTQGRAMTKDLYQFTNRGINIIPLLAKQFGILEADVYEYAKAGRISFKDVEKAFTTMTSKGGDFFHMMDEQTKTVGGKLSNMGDAWEQIKVNIGKSQKGIIASTVDWASDMLNSINEVLASANRMDEAFKNAKIQGYDWIDSLYEKIGTTFGQEAGGWWDMNMTGGKAKMDRYEMGAKNMYSDRSGIDKQQSLGAMASLLTAKSDLGKGFANKEMSKSDYDKKMAILDLHQKTIEGNMKLFGIGKDYKKLPESKVLGEGGKAGGGSSSSSVGSSTEISGARPQSLVININDGLVKNLYITAANLKEGAQRIREEVTKALVETVNDANIAIQ